MSARRGIVGANGLMAIVPAAAVEAGTEFIAIEVVFSLGNGFRMPVLLRYTLAEFEQHVRSHALRGGVAAVRQWLAEQAESRAESTTPRLARQIRGVVTISWICHQPRRREPFWR